MITKYVYDNDGNVAKKTDALAGVTTKYDYNDSNMLVRSEVYNGETTASGALESRMQYTYTKSGQGAPYPTRKRTMTSGPIPMQKMKSR